MPSKNITKIQTLATGLGNLLNKTVFFGGSVLELYVTDSAAYENRPSDDIDIVVSCATLGAFYSWMNELESRGFEKLEESPDDKKHSWSFQGIRVNLIPIHTETLGYVNHWYEEAVFHADTYELPDGNNIKLFPPAYYLAAKLEAYQQRGKEDLRMSEDFEDIVYLLGSRLEIIEEINSAFHEVRSFIRESFHALLQDYDLQEGICYSLPHGTNDQAVNRIVSIMQQASELQLA